ncbi:hypothetical protein KEM48_001516 [Puccinia striiformis f. sp. tritici PST-130]|nr:hypothetical protein KEM48_001516 [Puccinia striiformis f. sp. tritici PST-130]
MLSHLAAIWTILALLPSIKSDPFNQPDPSLTKPLPQPGNQKYVTIGYYEATRSQYQQPTHINWRHYTHMVFNGAWPIDQFQFTFGSDDQNRQAVNDMKQFVNSAQQNYVKPLLAVGGEQAIQVNYYYEVSPPANPISYTSAPSQVLFVLLRQWSIPKDVCQKPCSTSTRLWFQGVVINWLCTQILSHIVGAGCNNRSPNDVVNFGYFAQEFKNVWNEGSLIVRANFNGFIGATGNYATSEEASLLLKMSTTCHDLMAYDGYTGNKGERSGPFSALTSDCPKIPYLSNGIKELLAIMKFHGFPNSKLVLGFTGYGRVFYLPDPGFNMKNGISQVAYGAAPAGGWTDNLNGTMDACGQKRGYEGTYLLNEIMDNGWLAPDGVTSTDVLTRYWDDCAKQPYLFNQQYLLVYDDPGSLKFKSNYARGSGLAGISFYYSMGFPSLFLQSAIAPWRRGEAQG